MKRIAIVYGTKRKKATIDVAKWLKAAFEQAGYEARSAKPREIGEADFDAYVIGSAIYAGRATEEILEFIEKNKEELGAKAVAAFLVCKETECPEDQMTQILQRLPREPISKEFFEGYMLIKKDFDRQRTKAEAWVARIISEIQ